MKKIPTDYKLLKAIYEEYKKDFEMYESNNDLRRTKIYVPIDCSLIAKKLKTEHDIVFGRLYYHLDKKYGYKQDNGSKVPFFTIEIEKGKKCIHFPFMTSILAGLIEENKKFTIATSVSVAALLISILGIGISILI